MVKSPIDNGSVPTSFFPSKCNCAILKKKKKEGGKSSNYIGAGAATHRSSLLQTTLVQEQMLITGPPAMHIHPIVSVDLTLRAAAKSHIAAVSLQLKADPHCEARKRMRTKRESKMHSGPPCCMSTEL